MSAYIVTDDTINGALTYLNREKHRRAMYASSTLESAGYFVDDVEHLGKLGQEMFALNVQAVSARYPNESIETLPGEIGHYEYKFRLTGYTSIEHEGRTAQIPVTIYQALKSLECWHYQCAEGDIPDQPLYQTMQHVINDLQGAIINGLQAYEQAKWG